MRLQVPGSYVARLELGKAVASGSIGPAEGRPGRPGCGPLEQQQRCSTAGRALATEELAVAAPGPVAPGMTGLAAIALAASGLAVSAPDALVVSALVSLAWPSVFRRLWSAPAC